MTEENENSVCSYCNHPVKNDYDFCPECGTLFLDELTCTNHKNTPAEGVCIICMEPFCKECGLFVNNIHFLCNEHCEYEVMEGKVCVLEEEDAGRAQRITDYLRSHGFSAFLFSKFLPLHPFASMDLINNYSIRESDELREIGFKIFVNCQEAFNAEKYLEEYDG